MEPPDPKQAADRPGQGRESPPEGPGCESGSSPGAGGAGAVDEGVPVGPTPAIDFWEVLYTRRSIRRFLADPVPRELIDQVMHAGIWAPSSCNYQMWDLVAVDDPQVNERLAALSSQMSNAPCNLIVSYGRDFSTEGWANVQSAAALIQNMSLAARALGLGSFWITQMGDAEEVRRTVGLPGDRVVLAVLALGWPARIPVRAPRRRPLSQVTHYDHYAGRPIPSTADPDRWPRDLLAIYQRARVLGGLRHNKPRAWEVHALLEAIERLVPEGREALADPAAEPPRWLDVLPCAGILTERLSRERGGFRFDVVERTAEVCEFASGRTHPRAGRYQWPPEDGASLPEPPAGAHRMVSCLFRLENLPAADRPALLEAMARWVEPGGSVLIGFVNKRSFHDWTERLRARRGGPGGVEYVLSPDPNIGPFESLDPRSLLEACRAAGLVVRDRLGLQAVPRPEEIEFRARNFSPRNRRLARWLGRMLAWAEGLPGLGKARGRFQFLRLARAREGSAS